MVAFGAALFGAALASMVWALLTTKWTSSGWAAVGAIAGAVQAVGVIGALIYAKGQVEQTRRLHEAALVAEQRTRRNLVVQELLGLLRGEVRRALTALERTLVVARSEWPGRGHATVSTNQLLQRAADAASIQVDRLLDEGYRRIAWLDDAELRTALDAFLDGWREVIEHAKEITASSPQARPLPEEPPEEAELSKLWQSVVDRAEALWE